MIEILGPGGASRTRRRRRGVNWGLILHYVGLGLAAALLVVAVWIFFSFRIGIVLSQSMMPTLKPGDHYVIDLRAYRHHPPRRDDIVIFPYQGDLLVKRVVGLPGERLDIYRGQVYINGQPLAEPYLLDQPDIQHPFEVDVPAGHVFVLGDNRNDSDDSRDYGPISVGDILGRANRILSPPSRRRSLLPAASLHAAPAPTR